MRLRQTRPQDLVTARDFVPDAFRYPPEIRAVLPAIWSELLRAGQLGTGVVEDSALPPGRRVRGVGLSVFVSESFADEALADPEPYLNARLHRLILEGRSPVLDRRAIAKANARGRLTLMPLHLATPSIDVGDPAVLRTLAAAQDLFGLVHAGYRIHRIIKEVVNINLCRFMLSSGMRIHTDYTALAGNRRLGLGEFEQPYFLAVDHADLPLGSSMSMMFIAGEPRFGLSPAEQRVLFSALLHETDQDVADELCISPDTLRKHWRSIFRRVTDADAEFFPADSGEGRGRGKRRRLLQHIRTHMEELRPHLPASAARRRSARPKEAVATA